MPVHVVLTLSEDAAPAFVKPHYATEVAEDTDRGRFVLQVSFQTDCLSGR